MISDKYYMMMYYLTMYYLNNIRGDKLSHYKKLVSDIKDRIINEYHIELILTDNDYNAVYFLFQNTNNFDSDDLKYFLKFVGYHKGKLDYGFTYERDLRKLFNKDDEYIRIFTNYCDVSTLLLSNVDVSKLYKLFTLGILNLTSTEILTLEKSRLRVCNDDFEKLLLMTNNNITFNADFWKHLPEYDIGRIRRLKELIPDFDYHLKQAQISDFSVFTIDLLIFLISYKIDGKYLINYVCSKNSFATHQFLCNALKFIETNEQLLLVVSINEEIYKNLNDLHEFHKPNLLSHELVEKKRKEVNSIIHTGCPISEIYKNLIFSS